MNFYQEVTGILEDLIQEFGIDQPGKVHVPVSKGLADGPKRYDKEEVPEVAEIPEIDFTDEIGVETADKGFKRYINSIVGGLEDKGVDKELITGVISKAIKEFEESGFLPQFPLGEDGEEMDKWLEAAADSNFAQAILGKF